MVAEYLPEGYSSTRQFPDEFPSGRFPKEFDKHQYRFQMNVVDDADASNFQLVSSVKPIDKGPRDGVFAVDQDEVDFPYGTSRQICFRGLKNKFHTTHIDLFFACVFPNDSGFPQARRDHRVMGLAHRNNDSRKS